MHPASSRLAASPNDSDAGLANTSRAATVTSVAGLGTELVTFAVYAAWALGGVILVAALAALVAVALPQLVPAPRPEAS